MGRHHRSPVRSPRGRRAGVPAVLSMAVLAGTFGASPATAAEDDPGTTSSSAGALDPLGDLSGAALGTSSGDPEDGGSSAADGVSTRGANDLVDDTADSVLTGTGAVDRDARTDVTLAAKNGSGVSGTATITVDRVTGKVSGLDPDARYVSFFYGATSSATNSNPCILDGTNPLPSDQTVGEWEVDAQGNGTLSADNPLGARYALQAGTMSIRKVEHGFSSATALPVNPASYSLVACGEVERIAALDPVTSQVPKLPKVPSVRPVS